MTDLIPIRRELLERIPLDVLKTYGYAQTAHKIESILDAPCQPEGDAASILLPALRQYMHNDGSGLLAGYEYERTQQIIAELREEISDLHTTMMAAAVEIQEHWQAHCDEEGYGPANLMNRLERGIAAQYGYTAQTLVQIEAERDTMRQQRDRLAGLLRHASSVLGSQGWDALTHEIDAALAEVKPCLE